MRKVILTVMENEKYLSIKAYVDNPPKYGNQTKSKKRIAKKFQVEVRQVERWIMNYRAKGKITFRHGNHDKKPTSTISQEIKDKILSLYQVHQNWNFTHFSEEVLIPNGISISITSLTSILNNAGYISKKSRKRTKKDFINKTGKFAHLSPIIDDVEYKIPTTIPIEDAHPPRIKREYFGEEVQMDASNHVWFGKNKTHLYAAVDHNTGMILGLVFEKEETLAAYYDLFETVLLQYCAPYEIVTDNRTCFAYKTKGRQLLENDTLTQFGFACCQLGTNLRTTSVPEEKGQVERLFQTLQDRMINEMEKAQITTIEQANEFAKSYILKFNSRFAVQPNYNKSMFDGSYNQEEINYYLSIITTRVVHKHGTIRFNNQILFPIDSKNEPVVFQQGTIANIITTKDGNIVASINDYKFALVLQSELGYYYSNKKHVYVPPMTHYHKARSFERYLKNKKRKELYANVG